MENGIVKWFNDGRGYGFIARNGGGELFVHWKSIKGHGHKTLSEGERVQYTVERTAKGDQAVGVLRLGLEQEIQE